MDNTYQEGRDERMDHVDIDKRIRENISYIHDLLEASRKDERNPDHLYDVVVRLGQTSELLSPERTFIRNFEISKTFYKLSEAAETFGFTGSRNTTRLNNLLKHPEIEFSLYLEPDRVGKTSFYYHLSHKTMVRFYLIFFLSEMYTHAEIAEWQGLIAPTATLLPDVKNLKGFDELSADKRITQKLLQIMSESFKYTNELHQAIDKDNLMIKMLIEQTKETQDLQLALMKQEIEEEKIIIKRIDEEIDRIQNVNIHRIEEYQNLIGTEIKILEESTAKTIELPAPVPVNEPPKKKGFFARLFGETEVAVTPTINPEEIKYYVKQMKDEEDRRRVQNLLELQNTINGEIAALGTKANELEQEKAKRQAGVVELEKEYEKLASSVKEKKGELKYTPAAETIRMSYTTIESLYKTFVEEIEEIKSTSPQDNQRKINYRNKSEMVDIETE